MKKFSAIFLFAFLLGYAVQMQGQSAINTLTKKEVKQGWKLLFDGLNPSQWRSANKTEFPTKGWQIK